MDGVAVWILNMLKILLFESLFIILLHHVPFLLVDKITCQHLDTISPDPPPHHLTPQVGQISMAEQESLLVGNFIQGSHLRSIYDTVRLLGDLNFT